MKSIFSRVAGCGTFLAVVAVSFIAFAFLSTHAYAEEAQQRPQIDVSASGAIQIDREQGGPIYVEFTGSRTLTDRLAAFVVAQGFEVTSVREAARAKLVVGGELELEGGPKFQKRLRIPLSQIAQDEMPSSSEAQGTTGREVAAIAHDAVLTGIAYELSLGTFLQGVSLSQLVASIGVATGVTGRINTWLVGDPRGFCLSRCENWKKVHQAVVVNVTLDVQGVASMMRVQSKAYSETLAPVALVEAAMKEVVTALAEEQKEVLVAGPN
jgi:hypothetical protein